MTCPVAAPPASLPDGLLGESLERTGVSGQAPSRVAAVMPDEPPVKTPAATAARRGLNSVTNAFSVLEYLVEAGEAGVSEIARRVGVTVGTAHRLVATLVEIGWAEQNPDNRRYRPSQRLVAMATGCEKPERARDRPRAADQPRPGGPETGNLAIFSDRQVLYVDKVTSDQPFGLEARIGSPGSRVLHCARQGALASLDEAALDDYLALLETVRRGKQPPTPPPVVGLPPGAAPHARTRVRAGPGEYLPDVYCAAAPVEHGRSRSRRHERVGAAIAIRRRTAIVSSGRYLRRGGRALGHAAGSRARGADVMDFSVLGLG